MSFGDKRKRTRREEFLAEMEKAVPLTALAVLIGPHHPKAGGGRRPFPLAAMLRTHLMRNWFGYSDRAIEEALYEITPLRQFARLRIGVIPNETTLLNFQHLSSWLAGSGGEWRGVCVVSLSGFPGATACCPLGHARRQPQPCRRPWPRSACFRLAPSSSTRHGLPAMAVPGGRPADQTADEDAA